MLIPRDAPGFKQGKPSKFLNGEEWVQTYLDNVYIGPENVLLKEGGFKKQIMGGMGYTEETLVEYCFRKCRGWMIAGGSIEILKNRIAESVFERTFSQRPPKTVTQGGGP